MNKLLKYLFISLSAITVGLLIAVGVTAFTGPGNNQPPNGSGSWTAPTLSTGYLFGLTLSNNGSDAEHDINIAAGKARDATDAADMTLASAITKRFDATWVVGTGNGGMASGESLPTSGTIHIWLIKRSDTGVVDVIANNNASSILSPTLPAGYDYKRRVGSLRTDASANILGFDQFGNTFMFDTPVLDYDASQSGSANTVALSTPGGVVTKAIFNVNIAANASAYVSALVNTDSVPSSETAPGQNIAGITNGNTQLSVYTNTSSQIRFRANQPDVIAHIITMGWEDNRGTM